MRPPASKSRPRYPNTRPSDEEEDYFLQRSETGDSRLQQKDLLRYVCLMKEKGQLNKRSKGLFLPAMQTHRVYSLHAILEYCLHYLYPQENAFCHKCVTPLQRRLATQSRGVIFLVQSTDEIVTKTLTQ